MSSTYRSVPLGATSSTTVLGVTLGPILGTPTHPLKQKKATTVSTSAQVTQLLRTTVSPSDPHAQSKSELILAALERVPALLDSGTLTAPTLLPLVLPHLASNKAEVKANVCRFIIRAAAPVKENGGGLHREVGLLAAATLTQDVRDPNPGVREAALQALCNVEGLAEDHAIPAIDLCLKDSNPRVRQTAVQGIAQLYTHSPTPVTEHGLVDKLYLQIRDQDPTVLAHTMQTINTILKDEGGIVINNNMAKYLIRRLPDFPDLELCFTMEYLKLHHFSGGRGSEQRVVELLNVLDPYLDGTVGSNAAFVAAADLFYTAALEQESAPERLVKDYVSKVRPQLTRLLKGSSHMVVQEQQMRLLEFVLSLRPGIAQLLCASHKKDLHVRSKDMSALKARKAAATVHLCSRNYQKDIMWYLVGQVRGHRDVQGKLLDATLETAGKFEGDDTVRPALLKELATLLTVDAERFAPVLLKYVRKLRRFSVDLDSESKELLAKVLKTSCETVLLSKFKGFEPTRQQVSNVLFVLANFAEVQLEEAPYFLEHVLEEEREMLTADPVLLQSLLFCGLQVFKARPAVSQHVFGMILELCAESDSEETTKKVAVYESLLRGGEIMPQKLE